MEMQTYHRVHRVQAAGKSKYWWLGPARKEAKDIEGKVSR